VDLFGEFTFTTVVGAIYAFGGGFLATCGAILALRVFDVI
jgi:hypothetical protein